MGGEKRNVFDYFNKIRLEISAIKCFIQIMSI